MSSKKLYFLWDNIDEAIVKDELENFTHYVNTSQRLFSKRLSFYYKDTVIKVYSKKFSHKLLRKLRNKKYWVVIGTKSERPTTLSRRGLDILVMKGRDVRSFVFSTILTILKPYLDITTSKRIIEG